MAADLPGCKSTSAAPRAAVAASDVRCLGSRPGLGVVTIAGRPVTLAGRPVTLEGLRS